jgi:hypothetical protein
VAKAIAQLRALHLKGIDLLHKSEKGVSEALFEERASAFADKNPDLTDKFGRKCFAPTAKNRLLQELKRIESCKSFSPQSVDLSYDAGT